MKKLFTFGLCVLLALSMVLSGCHIFKTPENTSATEGSTDTTTETQEGTLEDKMTYNTVLTRKGNIGVTTSQQMARSEWFDLRRNQFVKEVLREFFDNVSVYC